MRSFRLALIIPAFLALIAGAMLFTASCKNKCGSTTCQNGGTCESNLCVCPTGYSGSNCGNSWSANAVGTYTCSRANCNVAVANTAPWQSIVTVDATNGGYTIDITNFNNNNITIVATIDSSINGLHQIRINNSAGIDAIGSYDSTTQRINLQYSTYSGGSAGPTCNMIMNKIH